MAGGRPPKWKTPEELQKQIDKYFEDCQANNEPLTITGLALALDTYRDVLMDYQNKDEFSNTIKKAKLKIENAYEKRLIQNGRSGDIFALKNFGWTDKQEIENNVSINSYEQLSVEELKKLADEDDEHNRRRKRTNKVKSKV